MKSKIIWILLLMFLNVGCSKYLDIVPDDTPTLIDAFEDEDKAESFVFTCYSYIPRYNHARTNFSWLMSNEFVSSYHWGTQFFSFLQIQQGLYNASTPVLDIWRDVYTGIRQCYIFLDNINSVKPIVTPVGEYEAKKKIWIAEVKFLIAYYHYVALQNYGPVALVKNQVNIDAPASELFLERRPYEECIDFIAKMFDEAMADLPDNVAPSEYGRATKLIAQSIKSRMYLYSASPLFNGNSEFYAQFKNKSGEVLMAQNYDKEKWKKALDETKKAITMAEQQGKKLYEYTATTITDPFRKAIASRRYTMVDPWNSELIWGYSANKEVAGNEASYQSLVIPIGFKNTLPPFGGIGPTLTAVESYYTRNGIAPQNDPSFDWANRFTINSGDSTIKLHRDREARFYADIGFDRGEYEISGGTRILKLRAQETNGMKSLNADHLYGGYACKKGVHPSSNVTATAFTLVTYPFPIIRLGELYLNYAEASAEYNGNLDADALKYINAIRTKAALPDFNASYGALSGSNLISAIRKERMIEMIFEGHWLYDLKRWKTAEAFFEPDKNGMRGLYSQGTTAATYYRDYILVGRPYIFSRKQYLSPIAQTYIDVNQKLVQNPGW